MVAWLAGWAKPQQWGKGESLKVDANSAVG